MYLSKMNLLCVLGVLQLFASSLQGAASEVDALLLEHQIPARFAEHRPVFTVARHSQTFAFPDGPKDMDFWIIRDQGNVVAYMPLSGFHGGSLFLLTHDPAACVAAIDLPQERFHIDTVRGVSFRTDHFLPTKTWGDQDASRWEVTDEGRRIVLHRSYSGKLNGWKWELDTRQHALQVEHKGVFSISLHPQLGYVVEGQWQTGVDRPRRVGQYVSLFPPGMCDPWNAKGVHDLAMTCPVGGGYRAHANNHYSIDACDNKAGQWTLRDGGFTAYLTAGPGWSWASELRGADARLGVCDVHADQDLHVVWPKSVTPVGGVHTHTIHVRQLRLPPELTAVVAKACQRYLPETEIVVIPLGVVADFEQQPYSSRQTRMGLAFAGEQPVIRRGISRSGDKSLQVQGELWPTLPQVALKPFRRYRLQAYVKVTGPDHATVHEARRQHAVQQEKNLKLWELAKRKAEGGTAPIPPKPEQLPFQTPNAEAYISAHYYKWTPKVIEGQRVKEQYTNRVTSAQPDWQLVHIDLETPAWGPFVDIRFYCDGGTAYFDDFSLLDLGPVE